MDIGQLVPFVSFPETFELPRVLTPGGSARSVSTPSHGKTLRVSGSYKTHIDRTKLYSFVYPMSRSKKSASSIVSDKPAASTDAKHPEHLDSSYFTHQRLWYVILSGTADG